ncbi:hypothetical protein T484DRAFT_1970080 [Baffinella frigidus]|nr:hypothetical protein T484DRAFT_1970080 [Cryptophyta sp. CCMP2293]
MQAMPERRRFSLMGNGKDAAYACLHAEAAQGLKGRPSRRRLSVDGDHLRNHGGVDQGDVRDGDPAAGKFLHTEAAERLKERFRSRTLRTLSADDACPPFQGLDEAPEGLDEPPKALKDQSRRRRLSVGGAHPRHHGCDGDPAAGKAPEGLAERIRRMRSVDGAPQAGASSGERLTKSISRATSEESLNPSPPIDVRSSRPGAPISPSEAAWARACPDLKLERRTTAALRCFVPSAKKHLQSPAGAGSPHTNLQPNFEELHKCRTRQDAPRLPHPMLWRQTTLKVISELAWSRASRQEHVDDSSMLGGALSLSLDHGLVL